MTPPTKSLDETAGKQPWSEEGLKLLGTLQQVITNWKSPVNEKQDKCTKPNCAYCNWHERESVTDKDPLIVKQSKINSATWRRWSVNEFELLMQNWQSGAVFIHAIMPYRTLGSIKKKIYDIRHSKIKEQASIPKQETSTVNY